MFSHMGGYFDGIFSGQDFFRVRTKYRPTSQDFDVLHYFDFSHVSTGEFVLSLRL